MNLVSVKNTPASSKKKLIAIFDNGKHIQFGSKGSSTYAQGASEQIKNAYIARHRVHEDWNKVNRGSLSRWVLWSKKSIKEGIKEFNRQV